ncbi:hypothetical protein PIB30_066999 [Stylosanthes scabra]|uniref:F-box domain-containing protein n=1 Tax=Stylosanthes scabra TaxID=79078 RepID=A0ABU6UNH5_9FABA|nr:hypothetical protein [Stylosanthes scabra]
MSVKKERGSGLPYLGDDILFKIFVKCHPKTVGRLMALSKFWSKRLTGKLFWEEIALQPPVKLVEYGYFVIIGSDRGNMCIRCLETREVVRDDFTVSPRLIDFLKSGGMKTVWFLDDMDNCIRVALRVEGSNVWFGRKDMNVIKSLYSSGEILLAHVEYRHSDLSSLYVTTMENKVLTPKREVAFFAGRVLPPEIQDKMKEKYGVVFTVNRLGSHQFKAEEVCHEQSFLQSLPEESIAVNIPLARIVGAWQTVTTSFHVGNIHVPRGRIPRRVRGTPVKGRHWPRLL